MYCEPGETQLLNMMKKVNKFSFGKDDKLLLMIDGIPMMRFKKQIK